MADNMADNKDNMEEKKDNTMLEETESYIMKMDAVERARNTSGEDGPIEETVVAEVNIVVDQHVENVESYVVERGEVLDPELVGEPQEAHGIDLSTAEVQEYVVEEGEVLLPQNGAAEGFVEKMAEKIEDEIKEDQETAIEEYDYKLSEESVCGMNPPDADQESMYNYNPGEDAASSSFSANKSTEQYYRDNGYPDEEASPPETPSLYVEKSTEDEDHSFMENGSSQNGVQSSTNGDETISSLHEVVERTQEGRIASLHQYVDKPAAPVAAPRGEGNGASVKDGDITKTSTLEVENNMSSSQGEAEFEDLVRQNIRQYKSEKSKSNVEVLSAIEREEGEDRPSAKKLLAWAKATRKPKTETMVVRQKKRDDNIKKAVDFGGVSIVLAEKKAVTASGKSERRTVDNAAEKKDGQGKLTTRETIQRIAGSVIRSNILVQDVSSVSKAEGIEEVRFSAEDLGQRRSFCWSVVDNQLNAYNKDVWVKRDLAPTIMSYIGVSSKKDDALPFARLIYADNKISVFDEDPAYKKPNPEKPLDEQHLKVGIKALARMHAVSFLYFAKNSHPAPLSNTWFTDPDQRSEAKAILEQQLDKVAQALLQEGKSTDEVNRVKSFKNIMFNLYQDAESTNSLLPVLCHGLPTLSNIQFKYGADGLPMDARFINLSSCLYGSGLADLHIFINTSGENVAREDFLLRFLYYETFASILRSYGEKVAFSYDDLKAEFVKKRLYGYIRSSIILSQKIKTSGIKTTSQTVPTPQMSSPRPVESKILGKFLPQAKTTAVAKFSAKIETDRGNDGYNAATKICEMMQKALKI